ncbi:MAG: TIGR02678 family protein [Actinophytocola sp.]|uniref:TIGR02678 family protein n=1 Tax=Actinophytocola sp. TaxID=1872138 RepID=UPI001325DD73|nr:TIGR02678 family protein [Actinophytocola sp.]MPZ80534.1 TIGR02678 family protein [Actinophytocola sp.]
MTAIPTFELADYQRAARTLLTHPLVTQTYPNPGALPAIRRWAAELREDLLETFGYRLELSRTTARLLRTLDQLDESQPARTHTDRPFDRRRYAYLALTLAALGRAGTQIALSELADAVAADAIRIAGLGLSTERAADRAAFVDAVAWLEVRGALTLADGSARRWADDPTAGEALYDIDRDVVRAVYRPTRVLQHLRSVTALLTTPTAHSRDTRRREAGHRARRALLERPVVYYDELDQDARNILRGPHALGDVERITGLTTERRAEGVAVLDTSGAFSDRRFPGTGTVAQAALLLIGEIADRIEDIDAAPLVRLAAPDRRVADLAGAIDAGLPSGGVLGELADQDEDAGTGQHGEPEDERENTGHPLLEDGWLAAVLAGLLDRYGSTFAAAWRADPARLLAAALDLLAELRIVVRVEGGVLALPLLARYRQVMVEVRRRKAEPNLFDFGETSE